MDKVEAQGVFDGLMLGDGGLQKNNSHGNAHFNINQAGVSHLDWLYVIRDALSVLGIEPCNEHPKVSECKGQEKPYIYSRLATHVSGYLTAQYFRWYKVNGRKRVKAAPEDISLIPATLAHWYMGDGSSYSDRRAITVPVSLGTYNFDIRDHLLLTTKLYDDLGIIAKIAHNHEYLCIVVRQLSVNRFMDLIEPYVVPSYMYRIKRREARVVSYA